MTAAARSTVHPIGTKSMRQCGRNSRMIVSPPVSKRFGYPMGAMLELRPQTLGVAGLG